MKNAIDLHSFVFTDRAITVYLSYILQVGMFFKKKKHENKITIEIQSEHMS